MIRHVKISDAEAICNIYNYYIANATCTFETIPVTISEMQNRIELYTQKAIWLVFEDVKNNIILGYAYANHWHKREAYRFTLEVSVYISNKTNQKGIASKLYKSMIDQLKDTECHTLLAIIALPNIPSIKLHEKFGFVKVAHLKETGYKFDKWIDVGIWQLNVQ